MERRAGAEKAPRTPAGHQIARLTGAFCAELRRNFRIIRQNFLFSRRFRLASHLPQCYNPCVLADENGRARRVRRRRGKTLRQKDRFRTELWRVCKPPMKQSAPAENLSGQKTECAEGRVPLCAFSFCLRGRSLCRIPYFLFLK